MGAWTLLACAYFIMSSMTLVFSEDACGGDLAADNLPQNITSPRYPVGSSNNVHCIWKITTTNTNRIRISPAPFDGVDNASLSSCDSGYIAVYDGLDMGAELLEKVCGNDELKLFTSTSNEMRVEFHSNSSGTSGGFVLQYTSGVYRVYREFNLTATQEWQTITSPGFPGKYSNLLTYQWNVVSPITEHKVCIQTEYFDIENSIPCDIHKDHVLIINGYDRKTLGIWCGRNKPKACSFERSLIVKFFSDHRIEGPGFKIQYKLEARNMVPDQGRTKLWAIVGGVVGAVVVCLLCILCTGCICWRQKRNRNKPFDRVPTITVGSKPHPSFILGPEVHRPEVVT